MVDYAVGALLDELGQILAEDTEYPLDGTFLYVEAEPGVISPSIFKDTGDRIVYRFSSDAADNKMFEIWEAAPDDKRWAVMQYEIQQGKFNASFLYPDQMDPNEEESDRRQRIVEQRYGGRKIEYPSLPGEKEEYHHDG